jgi:indolepyruvate ferredoxin oxidoreductase
LTFHLAPPFLPGLDHVGRPKKRAFGAWTLTLLRLLAAMKGLHGTALDPFGYTTERRMERRLVTDYRALVGRIIERLDDNNLPAAVELAAEASRIAGYGLLKSASVTAYESRLGALLLAFEAASKQSRAA